MSPCPLEKNSSDSARGLAITDARALYLLAYLDSKFVWFSEVKEYGLRPVYFKHLSTVKINQIFLVCRSL